jgi:hypothetical protein
MASKAIVHLKPGVEASSETALKAWETAKLFAELVPLSIANLQFWSMFTKIEAAIVLAITVRWVHSQPRHSTLKSLLNIAAVCSLGAAVVLFFNTHAYAVKFLRFCPKTTS